MTTITTEYNQSLFHVINPGNIYLSPENQSYLKKFRNEIRQRKKVFLITGEQGSGRNSLLQRIVFDLKKSRVLIKLDKETDNKTKLIDFILNNLEVKYQETDEIEKLELLGQILSKKKIMHLILHVDQTNDFNQELLEKTFEFVNTELFSDCSFHLVITALPTFSEKISEVSLLSSAIKNAVLFKIQPLSENEIASYINFHLEQYDEQDNHVFSEEALKRIVFYSKGLPRLISRLCSLGLLTANIEEKSTVTVEMIDEVLENSLFLGNEFNFSTELSPFKQSEPSVSEDENLQETDSSVEMSEVKLAKTETSQEKESTVESDDIEFEKNDASINPFLIKKVNKTEDSIEPYLINNVIKNELEDSAKEFQLIPESEIDEFIDEAGAFGFSKKSVFLPAFLIGVVFTGSVATGWYFSQNGTNQSPTDIIAENNTELLLKRNRLMEDKLKRLEKQLDSKKTAPAVDSNKIESSSIAPSSSKLLKERTEIEETIKEVKEVRKTIKETRKKVEETRGTLEKLVSKKKKNQKVELYLDANLYNILQNDEQGINQLLKIAKQKMAQKILTKPVENSAFSIYQAILKKSPKNEKALAGIERIANTYASWARNEIRKGNNTHALYLYNKAIEVSPENIKIILELEALQKKLKTETITH